MLPRHQHHIAHHQHFQQIIDEMSNLWHINMRLLIGMSIDATFATSKLKIIYDIWRRNVVSSQYTNNAGILILFCLRHFRSNDVINSKYSTTEASLEMQLPMARPSNSFIYRHFQAFNKVILSIHNQSTKKYLRITAIINSLI